MDLHAYIAKWKGRVLLLLILLSSAFVQVEVITPGDPCDPLQRNVTLRSITTDDQADVFSQIGFPHWMEVPLTYVGCQNRGLLKVPSTIPGNVEIFNLYDNVIHRFTKHDFKRYPRLVALLLAFNCVRIRDLNYASCEGSSFIEAGAFENLCRLRMLFLAGNILKVFPERLPNSLELLDISATGIQVVHKRDVSYLSNLKVLVARSVCGNINPPTCEFNNFVIEPGAFALNNAVEILDFHGSDFLEVPSASLPRSLLSLDFGLCHFTQLKRGDFSQSPQLRLLTVFSCFALHVTGLHLQPGALDPLTELEMLDLSFNGIKSIPENFFQHNQNLISVDLASNCLHQFVQDPSFLPWQNLQKLYLGQNFFCFVLIESNVSVVEYETVRLGPSFSNMKKLKELSFGLYPKDLLINQVSALDFNEVNNRSLLVLNSLPNLSFLDLSFCNILQLDMAAFSGLTSLSSLYLSQNRIGSSQTGEHRRPSVDYDDFVELKNERLSKTEAMFRDSMKGSSLSRVKVGASPHNSTGLVNVRGKLKMSFNELIKINKYDFFFTSFATEVDLSSNLLLHIGSEDFGFMPLLRRIDLRSNPIESVHTLAFYGLDHLEFLTLNSTRLFITDYSLLFLSVMFHSFKFQYVSQGEHFFNLLYLNQDFTVPAAREIDFSNNDIVSTGFVNDSFRNFPNVRSITLNSCNIFDPYFALPNSLVRSLDLSNNFLTVVPTETLKNMPDLEKLILFNNLIKSLSPKSIFNSTPNLQYLDLSFNRITFIEPGLFGENLPKLTSLHLRNNYIQNVGSDVFSLSFLKQISYLDIRWNPILCQCTLTDSVGYWLLKEPFYSHERAGFMPECNTLIDEYYGGCVQCQSPVSTHGQALLKFSTNTSCQAYYYTILCICFTSFVSLFLVAGLVFSSMGWKLWLLEFAIKNVQGSDDSDDFESRRCSLNPSVFAFHGFVCYDLNNEETGDWVDRHLIPNMCDQPPYFNIGVNGRDNHCGTTPVKQLLLCIEASRKVIVVLTGDYGCSNEAKYILSVLEHMEYESGFAKALIITFQNDIQPGGLIRRRKANKRCPCTLLQVPSSRELWPLFWDRLRVAVKGF